MWPHSSSGSQRFAGLRGQEMFTCYILASDGAAPQSRARDPIKGHVPQKNLLLCPPSPAWATHCCKCPVALCGYVWWCLTSYMWSRRCSVASLTLQHLPLLCLWSTSALLQPGAWDQGDAVAPYCI